MSKGFLTDSINLLEAKEAAQAAFGLIDILQQWEPAGVRFTSSAIVLILMCRHYGLDVCDVLNKSDRMIKDAVATKDGECIRAIEQYLKNEMR